jgi:hypothetical protein
MKLQNDCPQKALLKPLSDLCRTFSIGRPPIRSRRWASLEPDVAFLANGAGGQTGIYDTTGGPLSKVISSVKCSPAERLPV